MPTSLNIRLDASQLADLEHAIVHSEHPEVRKRAAALRRLHQGYSTAQVAQMMDVCARTVRDWVYRYEKTGLDGLAAKPRPG
jgi:transposase